MKRESSFLAHSTSTPWGNDKIDRGEHSDSMVNRLLNMGISPDATHIDRHKIEQVLLEDYPGLHVLPTPAAMDDSVMRTPDNGTGLLFATGQWIEYQGLDQQWHLGLVRRVLATAPVDYDPLTATEPNWEYNYNVGVGLTIPPFLTRAPEEGLKRIFGMRPWVFQQWCMLRVMNYCRFQAEHQRDFELMNFVLQAELIWVQWLEHSSNADFNEYFNAQPQGARTKLVQHILSPFASIERLSKLNKPGARWDFKTQNISIYSYGSVLGSGWITILTTLVLQILIPLILLASTIDTDSLHILGAFPSYYTTATQFCNVNNSNRYVEGLLMNLLVIAVYALRVAPSVLDDFFQTVGEGDTPASRLNSLRLVLWDMGVDGWERQLGFKIERYMKSFYPVFINLLMLFVLFLTPNAVDIILNALAVEFVQVFDVELARSVWFDPTRRWIKAGAVEMRMDATLKFLALKSGHAFCKEFDVSLSEYEAAMGSNAPIESLADAVRDADDPRHMTLADKVWHQASDIAKEHGRTVAIWQFSRSFAAFGVFDNLYVQLQAARNTGMQYGIFKRRFAYMAWSRWERVLFLPSVPQKSEGLKSRVLASRREEAGIVDSNAVVARSEAEGTNSMVSLVANKLGVRSKDSYLNYSLNAVKTPGERFRDEVRATLTGGMLVESLQTAWITGAWISVPFRVLDGIFEIVSFTIQLAFPLAILGMFVLNIICY